MTVLMGLAALGVDWGRVQLVKNELQSAADAAARYGAAGLQNSLFGVSAAQANAAAVVAQNKADGQPIKFTPATDVETGKWNASSRKFQPTTNLNVANAVRVTLHCSEDRGNAVPLMFMSFLGRRHANVSAVSIAAISYDGVTGGAGNGKFEYYIPATSNPWLAGMPPGTIANPNNPHNNPDYAGTPYVDTGGSKASVGNEIGSEGSGSSTNAGSNNSNWARWGNYAAKKSSPITAGGVDITPGATVTFDGINGGANNENSSTFYTADGNTGSITGNLKGSENNIANIKAPFNSVIGVFLNDKVPTTQSGIPSALDFSTAASRNFSSLSPKLRQPFFIGDGRTSSGETQHFVVPEGATRLFICTMDSYEWNNNVGGFNVTAHVAGRIVTVKERDK